jgi:hypothetical protein
VSYTEEELHAAIEERTAELTARVQELESAAQESKIEAQVAAVQAEAAAAVEELRAQLDAAVLEKQAAVDALDAYKAELEEIASATAREAEIAARRETRLAQVKEVASFPDEYLDANADRFAAMSDEDFTARLAEYAALAVKPTGDGIPKTTALTASRESTTDSGRTLLREIMHDSLLGVDPRTL